MIRYFYKTIEEFLHQLRTPLRKATKARKAMREPAMLPTRKTALKNIDRVVNCGDIKCC